MGSLIPGYEYDIYISYRQKDNKHDGWVTGFVKNLKDELEATFKEDISVYFDIDPHDGLLETHDVDESLREKLKCLIFIPIISRTYCDPKSFAWEHEFKAFVNMASGDRFGLKIKLAGGNVTSRILPIRIYDLDASDLKECEQVIGGALRGIEFIYRSPGVNRPLRESEEHPHDNTGKTYYLDQINKVANAINEIISGMRHERHISLIPSEVIITQPKKRKRIESLPLAAFIILLALSILFALLFINRKITEGKLEKSIAVLPFYNDSPGDSSQYFMDGLMDGVLNHLQEIKDLAPRSRTSAEKFRKTGKTIPEIAKELGVNYIVEGAGQKTGNMIHLNVSLYRILKNETRIWGSSYDQEIHDAIDIFSLVSRLAETIAKELNAVVTTKEKKMIEKTLTENLAAYDDYLMGQSFLKRFYHQDYDVAMQYFEEAKNKDPGFALAYVGISETWIMRGLSSYSSIVEVTPKAIAAFNKAYQLDSTLAEVHVCNSWIQNYLKYDFQEAELSCRKALAIKPNNSDAITGYANLLVILGRFEEAAEQIRIAMKLDPLSMDSKGPYCVIMFCLRRYDDAINAFREILKIDPENGAVLDNLPLALHMAGRYAEALEVWELVFSNYFKDYPNVFKQRDLSWSYEQLLNIQGDSLAGNLENRHINSSEIAQIYACAGNKERTLDMLISAFMEHDPNLPYIMRYPIFDFLRNETRFLELKTKLDLP
jgi:TolB-like protein